MNLHSIAHPVALVLPILLLVAAAIDFRTFRIPNWLSLAVALSFFPAAWLIGLPAGAFVNHIMAGVLLFFVGFIAFQFGLFGGGDAKLLAAASLWFGMTGLPGFMVYTALAGGVFAVVFGAWSLFMMAREIEGDDVRFAGLWRRFRKVKLDLPYAVPIAFGGVAAFFNTAWLANPALLQQ